MKTIAFVGCTKKKQPYPCRAGTMYRPSTLFSKLCDYIGTNDPVDALFILSAKHGLLDPETTIEPYNETLNEKSVTELQEWSRNVVRDLEMFITERRLEDDDVTLKFYCGERYRRFVISSMEVRYPHWKIEIPMKGLGIGQQLRYLS